MPTFMSHRLPAWIHPSTPIAGHFGWQISPCPIYSAPSLSSVSFGVGLSKAVIAELSIPNRSMMSPNSLNPPLSLMTESSRRWSEELSPTRQY